MEEVYLLNPIMNAHAKEKNVGTSVNTELISVLNVILNSTP